MKYVTTIAIYKIISLYLLVIVVDSAPTKWQTSPDPCLQSCDYPTVSGKKCHHNDNIPRFLFAGQSNTIGYSEMALPGAFKSLISILNNSTLSNSNNNNNNNNNNNTKNEQIKQMQDLLNQASAARTNSSQNEASLLYEMKEYLNESIIVEEHPSALCSYTDPTIWNKVDCERYVSPTACGGSRKQYGPELTFAHVFTQLENSPFKNKQIGITKVAVGGTEIYKNWMKENQENRDNYWSVLQDVIKSTKGSIEAIVWFQGENDNFKDWNRKNYLKHLTKFITDVRQEVFKSYATTSDNDKYLTPADIPVIIVELGSWSYSINVTLIDAQNAYVSSDPNAAIVHTGAENKHLSHFYHYDAAAILIIGKRIAEKMAELLNDRVIEAGM